MKLTLGELIREEIELQQLKKSGHDTSQLEQDLARKKKICKIQSDYRDKQIAQQNNQYFADLIQNICAAGQDAIDEFLKALENNRYS